MAFREIFPACVVIKDAHHLWKMRKNSTYKLTGDVGVLESIPNISLGETDVALCCEIINGGITLKVKDSKDKVKAEKYFYGEAGNEYVVLLSITNKFSKGDYYTIEVGGTPDRAKELKLWNMVILGVQQGLANWREVVI